MRNFNFTSIYKVLFICCLSIFLTNCEGEDGTAGPDGQDGIDGIDGSNGDNGANGQNGVGFEELTRFGSITITSTGTRNDNEAAFTDTTIFEFTGISPEALIDGNSVILDTETSNMSFNLNRFLSTPDRRFQGSNIEINLAVTNTGANPEFDFTIEFNEYNIVFDDLGVLQIDESYDNNLGVELPVNNFSITNFNFNEDTNVLTFLFSLDIDAENNDSQNDLSISGEVDVIVLENIATPKL